MGTVFGAGSSAGRRLKNADGTWNVFCPDCGRLISRSGVRIMASQCAICVKIANGEPITQEILDLYGKMTIEGTPRIDGLYLAPEDPLLVGIKKKGFSIAESLAGGMKAVGKFITTVTKAGEQPIGADAPKSVKIAREKKHKRVFDNIDLEK
jgi:predicted RNA-binding Zn-ribbon protein involved in translation (DUF1610 family)